MKIYTSYFGNMKKLQAANIKPICVAVMKPRFFYGPQMLNVAPTYYMISSKCSHEQYLQMYDRILKSQKPFEVLRQIEEMGGGYDVALCCYEKFGTFCHRHLLAKWLTEETGVEIEEFGYVRVKTPAYKEGALF